MLKEEPILEFSHYSVMLNECIQGLNIDPNGTYIDGTAGGAGHSLQIAKRLTSGRLLALDRDPDAVAVATERLSAYACAKVIHSNYSEIPSVLQNEGIKDGVDGVLLDLGVSSFQLDNIERGFSYKGDSKLDMRMSKSGMSAKDVVNSYSMQELARILREFADEKFAGSIAKNIVRYREDKPIETTSELEQIIKRSMPAAARRDKNPCKRTFQAIRMEVNHELDFLSEGLENAFGALKSGGRLVVITFHSIEDRLVKHRFKSWCTGCTCPPEFPVCVCGNKPKGELVNKKPILPSEEELKVNKRSQSAKLRIIKKL